MGQSFAGDSLLLCVSLPLCLLASVSPCLCEKKERLEHLQRIDSRIDAQATIKPAADSVLPQKSETSLFSYARA